MALMRGFSLVDKGGWITFPSNIKVHAEFDPGKVVTCKVLRVKGTRRLPHMTVSVSGHCPWVSPLEVIMMESYGKVDEKGRIVLSPEIMEELKLMPGHWVELKLLGPRTYHWIVVHNRGPRRQTTLQQRLGPKSSQRQRKKMKEQPPQVWEY